MTSDPPGPHDPTIAAPRGGMDATGTAPTATDSTGAARPPRERVSHYRIGAQLGAGGMGVVFRAVDEKLGRPVAIKFLTAERGDERAHARFSREARAASALDHPNIGTVYEIGEADGAPFIVMALYEGETLRARLNRGAIAIDETVRIARQLCAALGAAHQAGIVHRDLKPANVILLDNGMVKLLDFGLAKLTSTDESSLTREGSILGTLAYMAPEQLKSGEIDGRADLWALGALLYEMLSGQPPFGSGPAATVVGRILGEDPAPLSSAPPYLAAIVRQLLQKDPRRRIASADEVGRLLGKRAEPRARGGILVGLAVVVAVGGAGLLVALRPNESEVRLAAQARAKPHFEAAVAKFERGDFDGAAADFQAAFDASGEAVVLFDAGQSFRRAKQYGHAMVAYTGYLRNATDPDPEQRQMVETMIAQLRDEIDATTRAKRDGGP